MSEARPEPHPIPMSYWVEPGLLAGEYPGAKSDVEALDKLRRLLGAGVTLFLDLTEASEDLRPYQPLLDSVRYRRIPLRDGHAPTVGQVAEALDALDAEIGRGEVVYAHCWGGHGRTGVVVGCRLVRQGLEPLQALKRIVELRRGTPDAAKESPETPDQRRVVLEWPRLDPAPDGGRAG